MSTNADLAATYRLDVLSNSAVYAVLALVLYEHLITFKYEKDLLRNRKWNAVTWIFVINRYSLLADSVYAAAPVSAQTCNNSSVMNFLEFFVHITPQVLCGQAFEILRAFALIENRFWRLTITWILIILAILENIVQTYTTFATIWAWDADPVLGSACLTSGFFVRLTIANGFASIASAVTVLVVTLVKTTRQVQQASLLGLKTALSEILLRDGSMFFISVLLLDLFNGVPSLMDILYNGAGGSVLGPLTNALSPILLSRFIINLRQAGLPGVDSSANQRSSRFSNMDFRMPTMNEIVGNLGEPLDYVEYKSDDEDDTQDAGADTSTEQQSTEDTFSLRTTHVADLQA